MKRLIRYFVDLSLLRALPQDLPAVPFLLWLVIPLNLVVGVAYIGGSLGGFDRGLFVALLDVAMSLMWIWLLLAFKGHPRRFMQAATALLGSGALVGLVGIPLQVLAGDGSDPSTLAHLAGTLLLLVLFWSLIVVAHILRHTLEIGMGLGFALALTYWLLIAVIVGSIFPQSSS